jgi:DNA-binding CsgD family transcriptional regulator
MEDIMGRKQSYPVQLSEEEREQLRAISRTGKQSARVMQRAQILLWSDAGKQDKEIIALLGCAPMTVSSTRERWVKEKRLEDLPRKGSKPMLDGKQESLLIALACSDAPEGRAEWTMQLLADRLVELKVVDSISDETVRRTLKKTSSSLGKKNSGASRK